MLPSPRSSLSSFRDYYPHSQQNSASQHKFQHNIHIGFRNFQVSKLLQKLDLRVQQKLYWNVFCCFKKLYLRSTNQQKLIASRQKLRQIISKRVNRNFKFIGKSSFLRQMIWNVQFQRHRQLQILHKMVLKLSARYREIVSHSYYAICTFKPKLKNQDSKQRTRYLKKLAKALLCIVFRNLMHKKLKSSFGSIKHCQAPESSRSNIKFFKPKKGRQVYEHKVDEKITRLSNFIVMFKSISKRLYNRKQASFIRLKQAGKSRIVQKQTDSLQIMTNAVKHLVYLTSKENAFGKENEAADKIKTLKLHVLLKKMQRRQRRKVVQCLFEWREVTSQNKRLLSEQIEKLLAVKQRMLQDI